jgi:hypothetical protein
LAKRISSSAQTVHCAMPDEVPIMPHDSRSLPAPLGAPAEDHKKRYDDQERSLERRLETANREESLRRAPRNLLTALACARALLDELEKAIGAANDDRTGDVVIQVAEHLARLASTMTLWRADTTLSECRVVVPTNHKKESCT